MHTDQGQLKLQRARGAEQQTRTDCAADLPVAEDDRRDCEVASATSHPFGEAREAGNHRARAFAEQFAISERRRAERQDVDADARDDLIGAQRHAQERLQQSDRQHAEHADRQTQRRIAGRPCARRAEKCARQHHAFHAHVEHAGPFADQFTGRSQHQRGGKPDRGADENRYEFRVHRRAPCGSSHSDPPASATITTPCTTSTSADGTDATISILMPPERRKPNSNAAAHTPVIEPRASKPTTRPETAERTGQCQRADDGRRDRHAGAARRQCVQADRAQIHAEAAIHQHQRHYDAQHERDRQTDMQPRGACTRQQRKFGRVGNIQRLGQRGCVGHRLAQQRFGLHAPVEKPHRNERQQQGADHLAGAGARFQPARNRAPCRAGQRGRQHRHDERHAERQVRDVPIEADRSGGDATHRDLPFTADVSQLRAVRQHEAAADQREHEAAIDRCADRVRRAPRAVGESGERVAERHVNDCDQRERRCNREERGTSQHGRGSHAPRTVP
ncbi:hypothetical protein KCU90_g2211, partial [Aureobasidium melanogenum]